jgi:hypothetical protein
MKRYCFLAYSNPKQIVHRASGREKAMLLQSYRTHNVNSNARVDME